YVSSSYLYKIIKELNCRIKIFDLELEMFPKIRITGNIFSAIYLEWSVRTLFYMDEKRKINYEIKQFQRNFCAVFELTSSNNFNDEQKGYYFYYQW
ncbi:helix-turn-helix domain-containing protein, partial [Enterococcus faecium]|uniref:helix-turn-helix domain-containing protein n=1 Tax=Enterococcus faecium TaxID=1352 RepID=UPI000D472A56